MDSIDEIIVDVKEEIGQSPDPTVITQVFNCPVAITSGETKEQSNPEEDLTDKVDIVVAPDNGKAVTTSFPKLGTVQEQEGQEYAAVQKSILNSKRFS